MTSIDNRVVKMTFDNSQFEKNAGTSLNTIEKLKQSLNFKGASDGLQEINKSVGQVDMSSLEGSVQTISDKFNVMGAVAFTAIQNITNSAIEAGKKIASALTIDPIKMGFEEYETQINAVQTIMANTQKEFRSQGFTDDQQLEVVNQKLDELNAYADKTIYNFTEMTRNIGTFTAAGVDLNTATTAIQGFSNAAAISGASSTDASRGMYQLSQALSAGVVKLMDWRSIENANMGGQVFRDQIIETAKAHDVAMDQIEAAQNDFRGSLESGWLTAEIMTETLEKFTATTDGLTESEIKLKREMWESRGYTQAQIDEIFNLGKTATDAATKVKTFTQLIDTLKEALQSGWTQSWEYIIGDFEQAKELWTGIYTTLEAYINKSAEARNAILSEWNKSENGRAAMVEGLANAFKALLSIITPIKQAFDETFGGITAQNLIDFSSKFRDFTAKLILNEEQMNKLKFAFRGLFTLMRVLLKIALIPIKTAFSLLGTSLSAASVGANAFLNVFSFIGKALWSVCELLEGFMDIISSIFNGFATVIHVAVSYVKHFIELLSQNINISPITNVFDRIFNFVGTIGSHLHYAGEAINGFFNTMRDDVDSGRFSAFDGINDKIKFIADRINEVAPVVSQWFTDIKNGFKDITGNISNTDFGFLNEIGNNVLRIKDDVVNASPVIIDHFNNIKNEAIKMMGSLKTDFNKNGSFLNNLKSLLEQIKEKFQELAPLIKDKIDEIRGSIANLVKGVSDEATKYEGLDLVGILGVGGIAIAIKKIYDIYKKLHGEGDGGGGIVDGLGEIKDAVVDTFGSIQTSLKATTLLAIAFSIGVLAYSLSQVANIPAENLLGGMGAISILLFEMKAVMTHLGNIDPKNVSQMIVTTGSLVVFSFAVKELADAVAATGSISTESILKGLFVVTILVTELAIVAKLLSKEKSSMAAGVFTLLGMATAILMLTKPIEMLGTMDADVLKQGLSSVAILLGAMTAVGAILGASGFGVSAGVGLMAMATSLYIMYGAVHLYANLDWDYFLKGLWKLASILAIMGGAGFLLGIAGFGVSAGVGLMAMAASLFIMYGAIQLYKDMNLAEFASGIIKVAIALGLLTVAAVALGTFKFDVKDGLGLMAIAAAIVILAFAVTTLAGVPTLVVAASLAILFVALAAFGVLGYLLAPVAPVLMQMAIAIGIFALSAILISGALLLIVVALGAFGAAIIGFIVKATELIDPMLEAFTNFINASAEAVRNNQDQLLDALGNLLLAFLGMILLAFSKIGEFFMTTVWPWIQENGPAIVQGLIDGIVSLAGSLAEGAVMLFNAFVEGLAGIWPWIQENGPAIVQGLIDGILSFLAGIGEAAGKIFEEFCKAMDAFWPWLAENGPKIVTDLISGILSMLVEIGKAAGDLIKGLIDGLAEGVSDMLEAGANLVQGFVDGLLGAPQKIADAAMNMGNEALNGLKDFLGIASPSKEAMKQGQWFVQGFIDGIENLKNKAAEETESVGLAVMNALDMGIDPEYHPTISPVMDLSDVQNGIGTMNSMFDSMPNTYNVNGSIGSMFNSVPDTYGINGAIDAQNMLNNQAMLSLGSGSDYGAILQGMLNIQNDLAKYSEIMTKLNIVMDTGTLVGQLTPGIDRQLGRNAMMAGRGVL